MRGGAQPPTTEDTTMSKKEQEQTVLLYAKGTQSSFVHDEEEYEVNPKDKTIKVPASAVEAARAHGFVERK